LNTLMGDMLADRTTVRNLVDHYVPQARERFQKNAMVLAAKYRKENKSNRSAEAFAVYYYTSNPHGLPKVILDPLYKICAYGLIDQVEQMLPRFVETFLSEERRQGEHELHHSVGKAQWASVGKKVVKMGASGRLARVNTAKIFETKYKQLKPRKQVKGGAVRLNRKKVLRERRARNAQLIG